MIGGSPIHYVEIDRTHGYHIDIRRIIFVSDPVKHATEYGFTVACEHVQEPLLISSALKGLTVEAQQHAIDTVREAYENLILAWSNWWSKGHRN